ncbi:MAG TPA: periplasmic heavy metal sensor [Thermohalobaculum sp.]|nr:periplasmic heavy metal sensor [Thermohalobaculum sp.]
MSGTADRPGWRDAPGWMRLALAVSLAFNLVVAGLIGGNALRTWNDTPYAAAEAEPGLDRRQTRLLHMVPEARRAEARSILIARQDEIVRTGAEMRDAHMAFIEAIRADPLDPERLNAALEQRQAASAAFWHIGSEQMVEIARVLSAAERAELAERFEERTRRWMARWESKESEQR